MALPAVEQQCNRRSPHDTFRNGKCKFAQKVNPNTLGMSEKSVIAEGVALYLVYTAGVYSPARLLLFLLVSSQSTTLLLVAYTSLTKSDRAERKMYYVCSELQSPKNKESCTTLSRIAPHDSHPRISPRLLHLKSLFTPSVSCSLKDCTLCPLSLRQCTQNDRTKVPTTYV